MASNEAVFSSLDVKKKIRIMFIIDFNIYDDDENPMDEAAEPLRSSNEHSDDEDGCSDCID